MAQHLRQGPVRRLRLQVTEIMEDMFAIGIPADSLAPLLRQKREQSGAQPVEARNRAVMDESPGPVCEGMGVFDLRRAHSSAAHVGKNLPREDARGRPLDVLSLIGGPGLPFDMRAAVFIGGNTPAMGMRAGPSRGTYSRSMPRLQAVISA